MGSNHDDAWKALHQAVRAHELELNRATAAFEHALLAPLTLLNGGAAAAWLTFVGGQDPFESGEYGWRVWLPALAWGIGLGLAVWAIRTGWDRQRCYATAERWRREALEAMWLGRSDRMHADAATVLTTLALQRYYGGYAELKKAVQYVAVAGDEKERRERALTPQPPPAGEAAVDDSVHAGTDRDEDLSPDNDWLAPRLLAAVEHERGKELASQYGHRVWFSTVAFFVGSVFAMAAVSSL